MSSQVWMEIKHTHAHTHTHTHTHRSTSNCSEKAPQYPQGYLPISTRSLTAELARSALYCTAFKMEHSPVHHSIHTFTHTHTKLNHLQSGPSFMSSSSVTVFLHFKWSQFISADNATTSISAVLVKHDVTSHVNCL